MFGTAADTGVVRNVVAFLYVTLYQCRILQYLSGGLDDLFLCKGLVPIST